jgi:hypothetical protein
MKINEIETAMKINEAQQKAIADWQAKGWKLRVFGDEKPDQLPQMSRRAANGISTEWIDIGLDGKLFKRG